MKQSISATQIDKCTEIGHVLDSSFQNIANFDLREQFLLLLHLLGNQKLLSVTDDSSALRIELADHKLDLLILVLGEILLIGIGYEARRNEYSCLIHNDA